MLEERSQPPGPYIFSTLPIYFVQFLINLILPSGYPLHTPPIYYFHDATPFRDSHSRLTFATPIREYHHQIYPSTQIGCQYP